MESFYRTHNYLIEHLPPLVHRELMDEIRWEDRLIGIKGTRGVGKTTFLLQYAKEKFGLDRSCLYINMNHFYFTEHSLEDFAGAFVRQGGKVLLIDQVFKLPHWSKDIRTCYDKYPTLKIIFTGSSVMRLKDENFDLNGIVASYNLRGFSFREFLNLQAGLELPSYSLEEILSRTEEITANILKHVDPLQYFKDYMHHGFYPFFLEKRNYSENLLKNMNMIIEVDVLLIKQIELKYLSKIKKLLYLLAQNGVAAPNVSQLATAIKTSRATVMNYIKYLADARLINMVYKEGEDFPKKPAKVLLHNTSLMYCMHHQIEEQDVLETYFVNALWKDHKVDKGEKDGTYLVDQEISFKVCSPQKKIKRNPHIYYAIYDSNISNRQQIPLWLFGFLY
ncbi:MAG: AAA family ATPase [Phocaeicola sp.]|nr:AAA family ATPase [Phocaeicola sp.]MDD7448765.1 AAA family ATPase [Prevotellaceae bacterium]MDY3914342.1 AAA family ATPase [Phocaeicola sp.]MDY5939674.1 AAA family ATPase [Phocaeicola sp.]